VLLRLRGGRHRHLARLTHHGYVAGPEAQDATRRVDGHRPQEPERVERRAALHPARETVERDLRERWSALTTGIILGLVSAVWHFVPLIQMGRTPTGIAWWTLGTVALRILIVWLYNNTGKSVFATIVFHATSNLSLPVFPMDYDQASVQVTLGTITAMAAVIVMFLLGPKPLARFRYA
jgi:hypothetical protein